MIEKVGRNDPCPCGSGKKYKACCFAKELPKGKKKFTATVLTNQPKMKQPIDLMERTFGHHVAKAEEKFKPLSEEEKKDHLGHIEM